MFVIIPNITTTTTAAMLAYVGDLFTDLNLLIIVAIGLPLAFWVIRKVVGLVRAR